MNSKMVLCWLAVILAGCAHGATKHRDELHGPMSATTGVTRADSAKTAREGRIIPLTPMSGDVEILYGDPEVPGQPFVMRIHELPGTKIPPHTHPVDENITVLQGTWYFALGDRFDLSQLHELKTGAYAFAPKGTSMFGACPDGAVVQVHGVGPFLIHWQGGLHTLEDADASNIFTLSKGTSVDTPRGPGQIVHGYASGNIIQYELEAPDGSHFMADQDVVHAK